MHRRPMTGSAMTDEQELLAHQFANEYLYFLPASSTALPVLADAQFRKRQGLRICMTSLLPLQFLVPTQKSRDDQVGLNFVQIDACHSQSCPMT